MDSCECVQAFYVADANWGSDRMARTTVKSVDVEPISTRQDQLASIADNTLSFFEETVASAKSILAENHVMGAATLAAVNTLTASTAIQNLSGISEDLRRDLWQLCSEPAIARL